MDPRQTTGIEPAAMPEKISKFQISSSKRNSRYYRLHRRRASLAEIYPSVSENLHMMRANEVDHIGIVSHLCWRASASVTGSEPTATTRLLCDDNREPQGSLLHCAHLGLHVPDAMPMSIARRRQDVCPASVLSESNDLRCKDC